MLPSSKPKLIKKTRRGMSNASNLMTTTGIGRGSVCNSFVQLKVHRFRQIASLCRKKPKPGSWHKLLLIKTRQQSRFRKILARLLKKSGLASYTVWRKVGGFLASSSINPASLRYIGLVNYWSRHTWNEVETFRKHVHFRDKKDCK